MNDDTLFILDGYGLIYRAYHAFTQDTPLTNSSGQNITAVFMFFRSFFALIRQYKPRHFVIALDGKTRNFRYDIYPEYKATRDKTPEDLHAQIDIIENILRAFQATTLRCEGYEADDIIATLAHWQSAQAKPTCIISNDKDLMQLVSPQIHLLRSGKNNFTLLDPQGVLDSKGVHPEQVRDFLAIVGDVSDNVPGIKGIGEKTAQKLLAEYGSLQNIYEHIDSIKPAGTQNKLRTGRTQAELSQRLVSLVHDIPLDFDHLSTQLCWDVKNGVQALYNYELKGLADQCRSLLTSPPYQKSFKPSSIQELFPLPTVLAKADQFDYRVLINKEEIIDFFNILKTKKIFAFDCETDGLNTQTCRLVGMSFSYQNHQAVYIPVCTDVPLELSEDEILQLVAPVLTHPDHKIIGQNLKFDLKVFSRRGISFVPYFDTMIAAWLLDSEGQVNLDILAKRYLNHDTISFDSLHKKYKDFSLAPLSEMIPYACEDADLALQLYKLFEPKLYETKRDNLFYNLEMPLLLVLAQMELTGIEIDPEKLIDFGRDLSKRMLPLTNEIFDLVGFSFNPNSPKQLQNVLFEVLKLPTGKKTKSGYSTDAETLEYLAQFHPLPQKMLDYRQLAKLKSTYTDVLVEQCATDQRIHCNFLQVGTGTGRLSCQNPNLQNIPIRTQEGRKIRSAFKSTEGWSLVSADYSQIELVVLAYLAHDEHMLEIFESGHDLHQETAAFMFGVPSQNVTPEQRRAAKSINFGVLYGMSSFRLSNELNIPRTQADYFIKSYFQRYARIQTFMQDIVAQAQKTGGVYTLLGHWRPILHINSRNKIEKASAERAALNTIVQGTAADIIKKAMLNIDRAIKEHPIPARLLLQVHDELIMEAPIGNTGPCREVLFHSMQHAALEMPIPMKIQIQIEEGPCWGLFH